MRDARHWLALLVCAGLMAGAVSVSAQQGFLGGTYEVRRGDTLFALARKARQEGGGTLSQAIVAIFRANQAAFPDGNINLLEVGTILNIPARNAIAAIEAAEAERIVQELLAPRSAVTARPGLAQVPVARASTKPLETPAPKPPAGPLSREDAARRYQEGLAMERKGDHKGAFEAFLEAGNSGHGLAQRRLGQIYDKGSPAVGRDYQLSLAWYQKAREQGVEIPKQTQRITKK